MIARQKASRPGVNPGPAAGDIVRYGATVPVEEISEVALPGVRLPPPAELARFPHARTWMVVGGANQPYSMAPVGVWIGAGTPVGEPYPCRCAPTKTGGPCRRRSCTCFGLEPHDGCPDRCCRRSPESAQVADWEWGQEQGGGVAVIPPPSEVELRRVAEDGGLVEVDKPALRELDPDELLGDELDIVAVEAAKVRLREAGAHCSCRTPWDGERRPRGFHCVECHTNWSSASVAEMHRRSWAGPCRNPMSIVDVTTGAPLVRLSDVKGLGVWRQVVSLEPAPARRPAFKYE